MFEVQADLPDPVGPVEDDWRPWDEPGYDTWIDTVAAADPERPRTAAELLAEAEHGSVSAALGAQLADLDPQVLTDDQRVALAVAADRCENHYAGVKLRAVGIFAGADPVDDYDPAGFAWTDIAPALGLGEGGGRQLTYLARALTRRLPATLEAMLAGRLSIQKARAIVEATAALSDDDARKVEARVLPEARRRSPALHTAALNRAVRAVDPDGWAARRKERLRDVALIRESHGDGVADVLARNLDAVDAELIWTAADTWARQAKATGDPRTLDVLRVAYLVEQATAYLTGTPFTPAEPAVPKADDAPAQPAPTADAAPSEPTSAGAGAATDPASTGSEPAPADQAPAQPAPAQPARPPTRHGMPAVVNVIIGLPSLVGASTEPGYLAGTGDPLPADAVADLLHAGARIRFAIIDANGALQGISSAMHDPPALTRAYVALRDLTLRTPTGSTTAVAGHDLDHLDPNGPTTPANLHALTRGWHRAKTFKHWTVKANPDHTITWTSRRTGRTYTTHPYNHRDGP